MSEILEKELSESCIQSRSDKHRRNCDKAVFEQSCWMVQTGRCSCTHTVPARGRGHGGRGGPISIELMFSPNVVKVVKRVPTTCLNDELRHPVTVSTCEKSNNSAMSDEAMCLKSETHVGNANDSPIYYQCKKLLSLKHSVRAT